MGHRLPGKVTRKNCVPLFLFHLAILSMPSAGSIYCEHLIPGVYSAIRFRS